MSDRRGWRRAAPALLALALALSLVTGVDDAVSADPSEGATAAVRDVDRRVTVGGLHTCALLDDGQVQCWGSNEFGQLGNGTLATTAVPRTVAGISTATALAAGATHTCALLHDGSVRCWGHNGSGQLGDGSTADSLVPVAVEDLSDAASITTGAFHSCAVRVDGTVACWGHDGSGQLGDGGVLGTSAVPVAVSGITAANGAVVLTAGEFHTCALLADGTVRCWGHNGFGQLGDGTATTSSTPVTVAGITDVAPATAIAAGYGHTCAIRADGTASCWGGNNFGQLGDDSQTNRSTPVAVADIGGLDPSALAIAGGQFHTCALLDDGTARCWGENGRAQLGNLLASDAFEKKPVEVTGLAGATALTAGGFHNCAVVGSGLACWGYNFYGQLGAYTAGPVPPTTVTAVQGATTVTAGNGHACTLVELAKAECWGRNSDGQLGAPTLEGHSTTPVDVLGLPAAALIDAGNGHTCALPSASGTPACWGRNADGQLGDATTNQSTLPVTVSGLTTATDISAAGALGSDERGHTCAPRSDGTAACWGSNTDGQLGDDTTTDRSTPVTVLEDQDPDPDTPLTGVSATEGGGFHSCAIVTGGEVRCWGANGSGQLGNDTNDPHPSAVPVVLDPDPDPDVLLSGVNQLALGDAHGCALVSPPGDVYCWGANTSGQLGDGSTTSRDIATATVAFPGGAKAAAITAGDAHTCALLSDNSVACWGDNSSGQLGVGAATHSSSPLPVPGMEPPSGQVLTVAISAGRTHTCAALIDTTVRCWGSNAFGQVGDGIGPESVSPVATGGLAGGIGGNSLPVALDDAAMTSPATPVTVDVLTNDSDPDGDPLTLTGVADPDKGQAATGAGGVTYTPDPDFCTVDFADRTDTFIYSVSDGTGTVTADLTITVDCPNDAPTPGADAATTGEDAPVTIDVLANDSDPNGDPITLDAVADPPSGSAAIVAGEVQYTPDAQFCGSDGFTYTISDDDGAPADGTVTVTVTCGNDPPVAGDDTATTAEDTPVTVSVLTNDTDADGDSVAVTSAATPAHGTVVINGGATVTYTPDAGFCGTDAFTYQISDGALTDAGTVTLTVTCDNDGPNAVDDSAVTTEDTPVTVEVLANDSDPDGEPLTIVAVTDPEHGTATIAGDAIDYTPDADFCGADTFGYTVEDGSGEGDSAVVVPVTVICTQDPPVAGDDAATTAEDTPVALAVLVNDADPDSEPVEVASVTDPAHGAATIASSGEVHYTPDADFCGADGFDYTVTDHHGGSDSAHVTITVACNNDAPTLAPVGDQETPWGDELAVLVTASDVDGDAPTFSLTSAPAGAAITSSGTFTWTPSSAQVGEHTVTVRASDAAAFDETTFAVTVRPRASALEYSGSTSGQHSDPASVSAVLRDAGDGTPLPGRSVTFNVGSRSATAVTDATGTATTSITLADQAGAEQVTAEVDATSEYLAASTTEPFTILAEAVSVTFRGTFVRLTSGDAAPVTFRTHVQEEQDGSLGSGLASVRVRFRLPSGAELCSGAVSVTGPGVGVVTCSSEALPVGSQAIIAAVDAANYAAPATVGAFTVARTGKGTTSGAGRVVDPDDAARVDAFGFQAVRVNRAPPSGDAVHVFTAAADLGDGNRVYAFIVRSTHLTALGIRCSGGQTATCSAAIAGDGATTHAVDLATGVVQSVTGLSELEVDATDAGSASSGGVAPDRYAVAITGATAHHVATPAAQALIEAGEVRVEK